MSRGDSGKLSLSLPDNRGTLEAKAELVWVDGNGRAGVRFTEIAKDSRKILDQWLEEKMLRVDPLPDAKRFSIEGRIQFETCGEGVSDCTLEVIPSQGEVRCFLLKFRLNGHNG